MHESPQIWGNYANLFGEKMNLKEILDFHADLKNCDENLFANADPLQIAKSHKNDKNADIIALISALFAYGNAKLIVKFLQKIDFEILNLSEKEIKNETKNLKYRFQNSIDIAEIFITLKRFNENFKIENEILKGLKQSGKIIDGINSLIKKFHALNNFSSLGYDFFFGREFEREPISPYKRYNMFLRWMVRNDGLDLGIFKKISPKDLLMPLDVHTHKVSLSLGLIKRKSYDFKAVLELTEILRSLDKNDPIKYDFALYRLGQSGEIKGILENLKEKNGI